MRQQHTSDCCSILSLSPTYTIELCQKIHGGSRAPVSVGGLEPPQRARTAAPVASPTPVLPHLGQHARHFSLSYPSRAAQPAHMPPITINSGVEPVGASLSTSNSISTHMFNKVFKVFPSNECVLCPQMISSNITP